MTQEEQSNLYDFDDFIEAYARYRPPYPRKLYDIIYDFHKDAGGKWEAAHDVAAGPGVVAEELVHQFDKVFVSDDSERYVEISRKRCSQNLPNSDFSRMSFHRSPAEKMSFLSDNSVDMITLGTAIHWTQPPELMSEAARVLSPGGTLAAFSYTSRPYSKRKDLDDLLLELHNIHMREMAPELLENDDDHAKSARFSEVGTLMDAEMHLIRIPEDLYRPGARRLRWNRKQPMISWRPDEPFQPRPEGFQPNYGSEATQQDNPTEYIEDEAFVTFEGDVDWYDQYLSYLLPSSKQSDNYDASLQKLISKVGDRKSKFTLRWGFNLLLATKK